MQKVLSAITEAVFWFGIFLSPVLLAGIAAIIVYAYNPQGIVISILIGLVGIGLGILWAEKVRRTYGCTKYMGNILATPDLWPIPKEKPDPGKFQQD